MSAASTPAPRSKSSSSSSSESRTSSSRHSLFWPMLIFFIGSGALTIYQVMAMEDRLDEVTQAVDKLDGKVKRAQYEKAKFYLIARGVLRLAAKDPNADQVAVFYKLRQLQEAEPALMDLETPTDFATNTVQPTVFTNVAPVAPAAPDTNAAPADLPASPANK